MECINLNSLISCVSFCSERFINGDSCLISCGSYDSKVGIYDYYSGDSVCTLNIKNDIENMVKNQNYSQIFKTSKCGGISKVTFN